MRSLQLICILLFCNVLSALVLPYSSIPVMGNDNMIEDFTRIDPEDGKGESLKTRAWLWQDDQALVVHFEAEINEDFRVGTPKMRDEGGNSDYLRVQLVTLPEQYFAYYYLFFPQGGEMDGTRNADSTVNYAWDSSYSYESRYDENIWRVTARIPLSELRFKPQAPYDWKIILARYHHSNLEFYSSPYAVGSMGKKYFSVGHDIRLEQPIQRKSNMQIKPYFVKSYDLLEKTQSFDPENLGLDISLSAGQRTRVNLSFNPDYSDVPPDYAADNYNSRYPAYYSENRFFFAQDIQAFGISDNILYTRNIAKPSFAVKATGATQSLKWGMLGALDKRISDAGMLINDNDYFQVFSLRPNWDRLDLDFSTISRMNKGYYSHVLSNSTKWEFVPDWYLSYGIDGSTRKRDSEQDTAMQGYQSRFGLSFSPEDLSLSAGYERVSPDFQADAGYYMDTDYQVMDFYLGWEPPSRDRYLKTVNVSAWATYTESNLDNKVPDKEYDIGFSNIYTFRPKYSLTAFARVHQVLDLQNKPHQGYLGFISAGWNLSNEFNTHLTANYGKSLVYLLEDTYPLQGLQYDIWGMIAKKMQWNLFLDYKEYGYSKLFSPADSSSVILDDRYLIGNSSISYYPSGKAMLKAGASLDTYEQGHSHGKLSFYGSLRYEIMKESYIYMGFSSHQRKREDYQFAQPFDDFELNSSTAYIKLAIGL
ncbi:MAG: hypothetical protein PHC50_00345 [Candidatus Cloacimonetes bacterium]|nr:hypothetical protein [Candidatus Cloacimonadota bacterium]